MQRENLTGNYEGNRLETYVRDLRGRDGETGNRGRRAVREGEREEAGVCMERERRERERVVVVCWVASENRE